MTQVVGFSGAITSGKTSLSSAVAESLNAPLVSFGHYVRAESLRRGRGEGREDLQETGLELIEEGWTPFVTAVLDGQSDVEALVVDGIRHPEAVEEIARQIRDARIFLVYIDTPPEQLAARLADRGEATSALNHKVESELPEVGRRADLVLDGVDVGTDLQRVLEGLGRS